MGDTIKTDEDGKKIAPVDMPTPKAPTTDKPEDKGGDKDAKVLAGKFKTPEELEKAYTDLENKLGAQGKELGSLRKTHALLTDELSKKKGADADKDKKAEPATDYDAQLADISARLEAGDISVAEAIKQSNALTAEMTMAQALNVANKRTQELLTDKDADAAEKQFLKDHPDYEELVASGELQPFIDANPMLVDETIAYFQYKAQKAHDEGFEKGKEESERIAKAGDEADKVLKSPGTPVQRTPARQKPLTEAELEAKQNDTLNKMRGAA